MVLKKSKMVNSGFDSIPNNPIAYRPPIVHELEFDYENDYRKLGFKRMKAHVVLKKSKVVSSGFDSIPNNPIAYRPPQIHEIEFDYENDYRKLGFKRSKFAHVVKKNSKTINSGIDSIPSNPIAYKPPVIHEFELDYVNDYRKLAFKRGKAHVVLKKSKIVTQGIEQVHKDPITYKPPQTFEFELDYENDYRKLLYIRPKKAHVVTKEKKSYTITKPEFRYERNIPVRYEIEDEYIVPPKPKVVKFFLKKKPAEKKEQEC